MAAAPTQNKEKVEEKKDESKAVKEKKKESTAEKPVRSHMVTVISDDEGGEDSKDIRTNANTIGIAYKIRAVPSAQVLPKNHKFLQGRIRKNARKQLNKTLGEYVNVHKESCREIC